MDYLLLDIETIPRQDILPPKFDENSVKLGNIKDPAKQQEKIERSRAEYLAGLDKKMSVTHELCEMCSLAWAFVDESGNKGRADVIYTTRETEHYDFEIIEGWKTLNGMERVALITWNGKAFDIPVLWKRSLFHKKGMNFIDYQRLIKKYDMLSHIDLMHVWGNHELVSMKNCADFLNISCKTDFDGSMVYDAWQAGEHEKIVEYNMQDVETMYQICKRIGIF